jgi:hypothetical protein
MIDNLDPAVILGYMTVVAAASSLIDVTQSREGLGNTGIVLLVGYVHLMLYLVQSFKSAFEANLTDTCILLPPILGDANSAIIIDLIGGKTFSNIRIDLQQQPTFLIRAL